MWISREKQGRDPTEMKPSPVKIGQGFIIAVKKTTVPPRGKIACMEKFRSTAANESEFEVCLFSLLKDRHV